MGPLFSAALLLVVSLACWTVAFVVFRVFLSTARALIAASIFIFAGVIGAALTAIALSVLLPGTLTSSFQVALFLIGVAIGGVGLGGAASWMYFKSARFNSQFDTDASGAGQPGRYVYEHQ